MVSFSASWVLVMAAPPLVRRGLRIARRRVLPVLLPAEGCQVEEGPDAAERLDAAPGREVRAIDVVAVAEEDAEAESLARVSRDAEVGVEVAAGRGVPRDRPAHALLVRLDVRQRRARHQGKRGVAGVQVREMADLVDEHRTPGAARGRPALDVGSEHEVVDDQLAAPVEQIEQARHAVRAFEDVALLKPDHRQRAALGGQRVSRPRGFLLLDQKPVASGLPLRRRYDSRKTHGRILPGAPIDAHDGLLSLDHGRARGLDRFATQNSSVDLRPAFRHGAATSESLRYAASVPGRPKNARHGAASACGTGAAAKAHRPARPAVPRSVGAAPELDGEDELAGSTLADGVVSSGYAFCDF